LYGWEKLFDQSYLGEEIRYQILTHKYRYIQGITIDAHKEILDNSQNNAILFLLSIPES